MAPRDGDAGWREGERDGEREEGEREVEDGDGELCGMSSGRADARATMAEDSSLESHTVTSWRVCKEEMEKLSEFSGFSGNPAVQRAKNLSESSTSYKNTQFKLRN